ncbi:MAG: response regulator [Deltaproteobacteria bacterium]|nr:response regulator [Deltaproteobacteria bacterium]MBW2258330.1 response regulator [Deltaproteobacteria bacterium]
MTQKGGRRILVVDDEPDMLLYLSALLEDHDYEPSTAVDGVQAWEIMQEEKPDLVMLDLRMPRQTGLQLYRAMLADEALKDIPVVFISGMTHFRFYGEDCAPLPEPVARLGKPIDHEELLGVLRRTLGA